VYAERTRAEATSEEGDEGLSVRPGGLQSRREEEEGEEGKEREEGQGEERQGQRQRKEGREEGQEKMN
jgi:hypothetical protein